MTDTRATPPNEGRQRQAGFLAFWTTLPGILTGTAALITAVAGLISFWQTTSNGTSDRHPAETAQQQPIQSKTAPNQTPRTTKSTKPATAGAVLAHGRVSMNRGDQADLEQGLIAMTATSDLIFGPESTPNLFATANTFLAPTDQRPSKRRCRTELARRHDAFEVLPTIDTKWICVATAEGHIAAVTVLDTPGVVGTRLLLGFTVWQ